MPTPKRGPRDTTRAAKLLTAATDKLASAIDDLAEIAVILKDEDARTGRRDPSKRPKIIKRRPGV